MVQEGGDLLAAGHKSYQYFSLGSPIFFGLLFSFRDNYEFMITGVLYCPLCGKPLRVVPESNRWSNGKPRFKYVCPGFRKKTCTFKAVDGVQMDEFIVEQLSKLSDQKSPYYSELASTKFTHLLRADTGELEYQETEKAVEQIKNEIAAQVRNMRQADSNIRKYIQEDIEELSKEVEKKE